MRGKHLYGTNSLVFLLSSLSTCVFAKTDSLGYPCKSPGKFPHHTDPTKYHDCHLVGENKYSMFLQDCPPDTCFHADTRACNVDHCERQMDVVTQPVSFKCTSAGKFPHADSSRKDAFYKCIEIKGKLHMFEYQCLPAKPCFNAKRQMCQPCT